MQAGQVVFVDLAGSERVGKSGVSADGTGGARAFSVLDVTRHLQYLSYEKKKRKRPPTFHYSGRLVGILTRWFMKIVPNISSPPNPV